MGNIAKTVFHTGSFGNRNSDPQGSLPTKSKKSCKEPMDLLLFLTIKVSCLLPMPASCSKVTDPKGGADRS